METISRIQYQGYNIKDTISRIQYHGYNIMDTISWIQYHGYNIMDTISWIQYQGYNIMDTIDWPSTHMQWTTMTLFPDLCCHFSNPMRSAMMEDFCGRNNLFSLSPTDHPLNWKRLTSFCSLGAPGCMNQMKTNVTRVQRNQSTFLLNSIYIINVIPFISHVILEARSHYYYSVQQSIEIWRIWIDSCINDSYSPTLKPYDSNREYTQPFSFYESCMGTLENHKSPQSCNKGPQLII